MTSGSHRVSAADSLPRLVWDTIQGGRVQAPSCSLVRPDDLRFSDVLVERCDEDIERRREEAGKDTSKHAQLGEFLAENLYVLHDVDLIGSTSMDFDQEGLLMFLPGFRKFATWDTDHYVVKIFPNADWTDLAPNLEDFVMTQWTACGIPTERLDPVANDLAFWGARGWDDRRTYHTSDKLSFLPGWT